MQDLRPETIRAGHDLLRAVRPTTPQTGHETATSEVNQASELWHKLELFSEGTPDSLFVIPTDEEFLDAGGEFLPVSETLRRFYKALLYEFTDLSFLNRATVSLLWKAKGGKSKGNVTLGRLQKPSGLLRHFSEQDYVIWFAADHCFERGFTNWQMLALLYHQLRHATLDESGNFAVRGHEFEGFIEEIRLFGAWESATRNIIRAAQKLPGME